MLAPFCFAAVVLVSSGICANTCDDLAALALPGAKITSVHLFPAGSSFTAPPDGFAQVKTYDNLPAFCRVSATLAPAPDSNIWVEAWLPATSWNQKFLGTGNGGYAGSIVYPGMADALKRGYAVANTDMGTAPALWWNAAALAGHPEKWRDFGHRATHLMTQTAKRLINAYYGSPPARSYFRGCSTGGQQGLMEAQRYPEDYDGIIAGAPGNNRTHLLASFVWVYGSTQPAMGRLSSTKLGLLHQKVLEACVISGGGAPPDKFLNDPRDCHFDPHSLQCAGADAPTCLTGAEVVGATRIYDGPRNPGNGHLVYPGLPRGSEVDWLILEPPFSIPGLPAPFGQPAFDGMFRWVFGPNWNWQTFDFNEHMAKVDDALASTLNANDPDLRPYEKRGGKLIIYHGQADPLVAPQNTINYYNRVVAAQKAAGNLTTAQAFNATRQFARLFLAPGMTHCLGGPGPNVFNGADNLDGPQDSQHDVLTALDHWVMQGTAPDMIIATRFPDPTNALMTRPMCAYPYRALYVSGDANVAASFKCVVHRDFTNPTPPAAEYER